MQASFWHQKWSKGEIAFHQSKANPLLVAHLEKMNLANGSRVFIPLCGKTRDIAWLLDCGYRVVGIELSELAVVALFDELGVVPSMARVGELILFSAKGIDIFVGDIFALSAEFLGLVDLVYDRAALVALPENIRNQYSSHIVNITNAAPQMLINYVYDQRLYSGPPFSISKGELERHFAATHQLKLVETKVVVGGFKGKVPSTESVWLLEKP